MKKLLFLVFTLSVSFAYSQIISPDSTTPELLWESEVQGFRDLVIHPNGNIIAKRKAEVFELDGLTGKIIREFPVFTEIDDIESISISNDGKFIATGFSQVNIIDYQTSNLIWRKNFPGPRVAFFPDSKRLLIMANEGSDKNLAVYNISNETLTYHNIIFDTLSNDEYQQIENIALSNDGLYIAIGGFTRPNFGSDEGKTYLTLYDATTFQQIKLLYKHNIEAEVRSIKFSKDGRYVGYHWNWGYLAVYDLENLDLVNYFDQQDIPTNGVRSFCFINDSVISISSYDYTQLRNIHTKKIYYNANGVGNANGLEFNGKFSSLIVSDWHVGTIKAYDYHGMMTSNIDEMRNNQYFIIHYQNNELVINNINNNLINNISISDINGKIITSQDYNPFEIHKQVIISLKLATGAYFIQIQSGAKQYSQKFIVSN